MPIPANFPFPRSGSVESFDAYASASVPAATVDQVLVTLTVPQQAHRAYLTLFGHGIDDVSAWPLSVWRIRRNRIPVRDYNNIQDQLAEFQDPKEVGPVVIHAGETVDVVVTNNTALAHLYAARIRGFYDYQAPKGM